MKLNSTKKITENTEFMKVIDHIKKLGWNVDLDDNEYVYLQRYSTVGQDFNISMEIGNDIESFIKNIYDYYENFDVSYETYLWLDSTGHGKNGAPYDMRDAYNDMEECEQFIYQLYIELEKNFLK